MLNGELENWRSFRNGESRGAEPLAEISRGSPAYALDYWVPPESLSLQFRTSSETVNSCSVKIIQEKEVNRKITW